jgi:hypothetical protein
MPRTSFSDHRTGASEKIRSTLRKTLFNNIGHQRPIGSLRRMSALLLLGLVECCDLPVAIGGDGVAQSVGHQRKAGG